MGYYSVGYWRVGYHGLMMESDTRGRRRLGRAQRRGLILHSATEHFARAGYHGASLDLIAAGAGVSKPVLYDHFPSKQALFAEVLRQVRAELLGAGTQAVQATGTPEERVRAALLGFFTSAGAAPYAMRVLLGVSRGEPELEALSLAIQTEVTDTLLALLLSMLPGPPPAAAQAELRLQLEFIKQGLHGLAEWWPSQPNLSAEALTDAVMGVIWPGVQRALFAPLRP